MRVAIKIIPQNVQDELCCLRCLVDCFLIQIRNREKLNIYAFFMTAKKL